MSGGARTDHSITVKGPVALNLDNATKMQGHLEGVFQYIIDMNLALSKRPPRVAARDLNGLDDEAAGLVSLLGTIGDSAERWPDVKRRLDAELKVERDALEQLRKCFSTSSRDSTVEYDLCTKILTSLKTLLEHMVTVLEIADDVPVCEIQGRTRRCKEQLADIRQQDADGLTAYHNAIDINHDNIRRSVKNRLVVIEATEPNRRLAAAWDACEADYEKLKTRGNDAALADKMDRVYDELIAAGAYKPPIVFEVDSDHMRQVAAKLNKPYKDQLDDSADKLQLGFAELDELLNGNGSPADIAKCTKGLIGEIKNEASLARAMAGEAEDKGRAANFRNAANKLDKHAPELATAAKKYCKAKAGNQSLTDPEAALREQMEAVQAQNDKLKALMDPDRQPPPSLLTAVASALAGLDALVAAANDAE